MIIGHVQDSKGIDVPVNSPSETYNIALEIISTSGVNFQLLHSLPQFVRGSGAATPSRLKALRISFKLSERSRTVV